MRSNNNLGERRENQNGGFDTSYRLSQPPSGDQLPMCHKTYRGNRLLELLIHNFGYLDFSSNLTLSRNKKIVRHENTATDNLPIPSLSNAIR